MNLNIKKSGVKTYPAPIAVVAAGGIWLKLWTSEPEIKYHPSTNTKKTILKGREIITGGNIIIPIDIKIEAVTISMIRKGRNNIKPISKARRSSEIMKEGIRTWIGTSIGSA